MGCFAVIADPLLSSNLFQSYIMLFVQATLSCHRQKRLYRARNSCLLLSTGLFRWLVQQLPHFGRQGLQRERLVNHLKLLIQHAVAHDRIHRVSGHGHCLEKTQYLTKKVFNSLSSFESQQELNRPGNTRPMSFKQSQETSPAWFRVRLKNSLVNLLSASLVMAFRCLLDFHRIFTYPSFLHPSRQRSSPAIERTHHDTLSHAPGPAVPKTSAMARYIGHRFWRRV